MGNGNGNGLTNAITKQPWWATAPIYLSLGIIGVPSMLAIGAGYFLAANVTKHLTTIRETNVAEMAKLDQIMANQQKYWEIVRRTVAATFEVQVRTCVNEAKDKPERDNCLRGISGVDVKDLQK